MCMLSTSYTKIEEQNKNENLLLHKRVIISETGWPTDKLRTILESSCSWLNVLFYTYISNLYSLNEKNAVFRRRRKRLECHQLFLLELH